MQDESVVPEQTKSKQRNSVRDELGNIDDNTTSPTNENINYVCTEDEIGVTLDYQPTNLEVTDGDNRSVSTSRSAHSSRQRHRSRHRRSHREAVRASCTNSWILPFLSGMFTGLIFLIIGIVFVIYFRQLPNYIGILFILVSIPPFCMAVNKYRSFRQGERMRRRMELRRQVIREMRNNENDAYRNGSLPFSDMPPSYTNLAFDHPQGESRSNNDVGDQSNLSLSSSNEIGLPTYKDAVKTYKDNEQMMRRSSDVSELELPKYEEDNDVTTERFHEVPHHSSLAAQPSVSSIYQTVSSSDPPISPPGRISSSSDSVNYEPV